MIIFNSGNIKFLNCAITLSSRSESKTEKKTSGVTVTTSTDILSGYLSEGRVSAILTVCASNDGAVAVGTIPFGARVSSLEAAVILESRER